ncbi:MAG: hypothetical protein RIR97_1706, partial [Pseudomonadota bacterium]
MLCRPMLAAFFAVIILNLSLSVASADQKAVVEHYAALARAKFGDTLTTVKALDEKITAFLAKPDDTTLKAARDAWITSRHFYSQTEAFRFGNPVVDAWEGAVNAWPLDEGLIDYVDADYGTESDGNTLYVANVIASKTILINGKDVDVSTITPYLLKNSLHEAGGISANVATGYHAIEFLLWGQDLNGTGAGAGNRPATDYDLSNCTNGNCDRRVAYLKTVSKLLVDDLEDIVAKFQPDGAAAKVLTDDPVKGITALLTGMGSLSYGELAGERMKLALLLHDTEEEPDCFSDNTARDHRDNMASILSAYTGTYERLDGPVLKGPSIRSLVQEKDKDLDVLMMTKLTATMATMDTMVDRAEKIEAYDQMIAEGNTDGNAVVQAAIDGLIDQTTTIERV